MKKGLWLLGFLLFSAISFADTILLKSGQEFEGKIIEKTNDKIKFDTKGVVVTFRLDEIDKVKNENGEIVDLSLTSNIPSSPQTDLYYEVLTQLKLNREQQDLITRVLIKGEKLEPEQIDGIFNKENQQALDLFKNATQQSKDGDLYLKPPGFDSNSKSEGWKMFMKLLTHFKLILIQGNQNVLQGQYKKAEENYLINVRFLRHLFQEKSPLIISVIEFQILIDSYFFIPSSIQNNSLSREYYTQLLKELLSFLNYRERLKSVFQNEFEYGLEFFKYIEQDAKNKGLYNEEYFSKYFSLSETLVRQKLASQIEAIDNKKHEVFQSKNEGEDFEEPPLSKKPEFCSKDLFSLTSTEVFICNSTNDPEFDVKRAFLRAKQREALFISNFYVTVSKLNNMSTAVALRLYQMENGKFPEMLEELVPKYLPQVPEDPFNGFQSIKYINKEEGFLIYSLGPDQQDQAGSVEFDRKTYNLKDTSKASGDIVFTYKINR